MSATNTDLVSQSCNGSRESFCQLVERYQTLVRAVALSASGDLAVSEELTQEAFVTAWTRLPELRDPEYFGSWVCGIARNLARYARRHQGRHAPAATESCEHLAQLPADEPSPLDVVIERQEQVLVREALCRIPASYREPLVLFYGQNHTIAEVAGQLGVSSDTVKQRLSRGRKYLQRGVQEMLQNALARPVSVAAAVFAAISLLPHAQAAALGIGASAGASTGTGLGASLGTSMTSGFLTSAKLAFTGVVAASITVIALAAQPGISAHPQMARQVSARQVSVTPPRLERAPRIELDVAVVESDVAVVEPVDLAQAQAQAPANQPNQALPNQAREYRLEPVLIRTAADARSSSYRTAAATLPASPSDTPIEPVFKRAIGIPVGIPTVIENGPMRVSRAHPGPSLSLMDAFGEPPASDSPSFHERLPIEPPDLAARILEVDI